MFQFMACAEKSEEDRRSQMAIRVQKEKESREAQELADQVQKMSGK